MFVLNVNVATPPRHAPFYGQRHIHDRRHVPRSPSMPRTPVHPGLLLYAIIPETLYFIQCYLLVAPQSSFSRIVRAVIGLVAGPWLAVLPFVIKWAPSDLIIPNVVISESLFSNTPLPGN